MRVGENLVGFAGRLLECAPKELGRSVKLRYRDTRSRRPNATEALRLICISHICESKCVCKMQQHVCSQGPRSLPVRSSPGVRALLFTCCLSSLPVAVSQESLTYMGMICGAACHHGSPGHRKEVSGYQLHTHQLLPKVIVQRVKLPASHDGRQQ